MGTIRRRLRISRRILRARRRWGVAQAFPDLQAQVQWIVAMATMVVVFYSMRGTRSGDRGCSSISRGSVVETAFLLAFKFDDDGQNIDQWLGSNLSRYLSSWDGALPRRRRSRAPVLNRAEHSETRLARSSLRRAQTRLARPNLREDESRAPLRGDSLRYAAGGRGFELRPGDIIIRRRRMRDDVDADDLCVLIFQEPELPLPLDRPRRGSTW